MSILMIPFLLLLLLSLSFLYCYYYYYYYFHYFYYYYYYCKPLYKRSIDVFKLLSLCLFRFTFIYNIRFIATFLWKPLISEANQSHSYYMKLTFEYYLARHWKKVKFALLDFASYEKKWVIDDRFVKVIVKIFQKREFQWRKKKKTNLRENKLIVFLEKLCFIFFIQVFKRLLSLPVLSKSCFQFFRERMLFWYRKNKR